MIGFGWLHPASASASAMAIDAAILSVFMFITLGASVSFKQVILPHELPCVV